MTRIQAKLVVAGAVLAIAVGYLGVTGAASGWVYFVDVEKFLADPQYRTQRVRLHGKVEADGLVISSAGLKASFQLAGENGGRLPVVYGGNIPELFGAGKDVVVEGKIDPISGAFKADILMTKCASKYEGDAEGKPAHSTEGPA